MMPPLRDFPKNQVNNLSCGFLCPVDLRESPRRAEIVMGLILKNMDPIAILSIRGFDAVQRADKPKTQVNRTPRVEINRGRAPSLRPHNEVQLA